MATQYARPVDYRDESRTSINLDTFTGKIYMSFTGLNEKQLCEEFAELIKKYPPLELINHLQQLNKH